MLLEHSLFLLITMLPDRVQFSMENFYKMKNFLDNYSLVTQ